MKKITKYISIFVFFIFLLITSLYSYLTTSLISRYFSFIVGMIMSISIFLLFAVLAIAFNRNKYADSALWAISIVFFITSVGLVGQLVYNKVIDTLGLLMFVILGFFLISIGVFFGILSLNKVIKKGMT